MLVIAGVNGLTGLEILREAQARGLAVRGIVRDDGDLDRVKGMADVRLLSYADPMVPEALDAVLVGATRVISCIDPRTSGPGALMYEGQAAENIVRAAGRAGASTILHVSVMGSFRWSYAQLNRASFYLEGGVKNVDAPWTIVRVSSYFDEVVEGHVRPPDGKAPWAFRESSRYAPMSRRDAAAALVHLVDHIERPGRALSLGGPQVFTGPELEALVAPFREQPALTGRPLFGGQTVYKPLPPGDVSVDLDTTRAVLGRLPQDRLEDFLREGPPPPRKAEVVYPRETPPPHPADAGHHGRVLQGEELARVVHSQLVSDLARMGVEAEGVTLDFRGARAGSRLVKAHGGTFSEARGVKVVGPEGERFVGDVAVLRDTLAEEFHCWWVGDGIPESVWTQLDMGVRRRLTSDPGFRADPRVRDFAEHNGL